MFGWLNPDEKRDLIKYVTLCGVILGSIIAAIMIVDVYNCYGTYYDQPPC